MLSILSFEQLRNAYNFCCYFWQKKIFVKVLLTKREEITMHVGARNSPKQKNIKKK